MHYEDPFTEELNKNIEKYNKIVLRPFWKDNIFRSAGGTYIPNQRCDYFEATPLISAKLLSGTPLEYKGNNKFLHYTSLQSLISILKSKKIRLYDFNNFNDPTEFIYTNKYFRKFENSTCLREYKRQLFGLSMCEFEENVVNNNINLWRLYSDNGKGACITFEIDKENIENIQDFSFGKINYNQNLKNISELDDIITRDERFKSDFNFYCSNLSDVIAPLCCFYKSDLFSIEKEVRLFHFSKRQYYKHSSEHVQFELNKDFKKVYFVELPIDRMIDKFIPFLKINTVHLGYNLSQDAYNEALDTITELKFPYNFDISWAPIKKHFE